MQSSMQSSMRSVLSFPDAPQLTGPEAHITFDRAANGTDGERENASTAAFLHHYMAEYHAFGQRVPSSSDPGHIAATDPDSAT